MCIGKIQKELIKLICTWGPTKWQPAQWPGPATNLNLGQPALTGNASLSRKLDIHQS